LIEKHIVLEDIDPVVFYGVGNGHLQMLKSLFPKLRIVARDNVIRLLGDEEEMAKAEEDIETMRKHVLKYNKITEEDILDIVNGKKTKDDAAKGVLVYSISGRPIKSRSENQQKLIDAFDKSDMVFAVGPAGTGKTYLSIALAVKALKEKAAKKIILSRPAVEAGEKLGFLPGDMKDKIDPYLQPLYDALEDMIPAVKLQDMMDKHVIQIAPLAFMRGRTLSDAVVILDEAQNTTPAQIRMFLTRMGWNTKMIITGDMTQIDLPRSQMSGLKEALKILTGIEGISVVNLTKKDIVRHKLVTRIVNAYEAYDKAKKSPPTLPQRDGA
jgi:phosphate starvation-inducible PhoH-like protein